MITTRLTARDNAEIVTDQIAMILVNELANQRTLARTARADPGLYELSVYTERANLFEQVLNAPTDRAPIVNVWFDSGNYDQSQSNISERQKLEATYNIDVYGFGLARDTDTGFIAGDEDASREVMRAARLVRQILMSANNTYLQLQGTVWQRWISTLTKFQPQLDDRALEQVHAGRIALSVGMNEFSPQAQPARLCEVALDVLRREDGRVVAQAEYDFTEA